jgi:hypothetical protein
MLLEPQNCNDMKSVRWIQLPVYITVVTFIPISSRGKTNYPLELGDWFLVDLAARPLYLATISLLFSAGAQ